MTDKEQLQPIIDDLVERHKGCVGTYFGIPFSEFEKDELIAIIGDMMEREAQMRESHRKSMDLMAGFRRRSS